MEISALVEWYKQIFTIDFLRYILPVSTAFILFWVILKKKLSHRFIQKKRPEQVQFWFEFKYSMSTVVIFAFIGVGIRTTLANGGFHLYGDLNEFGIGYFLLSIMLMVIMHDFYFYWTHRWMHYPKIFKYVHKVHHLSTSPSPWAAYSFHPFEAVIQGLILPIILLILPVHGLAIFIFLIYMIVRNVLGHLGYELFPKNFLKAKWLNWHTTTTHHSMHHQYFNANYGLYFTWWDNWMKTTHSKYEESFEEVTSKKSTRIKEVAIILVLFFSVQAAAQSPVGQWVTFNESTGEPLSVVRILQNAKTKTFEGVIDSVIVPSYVGENGRCMLCEGDKKGQPLIGLELLWDYKLSGKIWSGGKIVDPESGTVYDSKIWFANDDSIYVRGYAGPFNLFYRTQTWRRKSGQGIEGIWETIDDRFNLVKSEVELRIVNGQLKGYLRKIFLMPYEGNYPICTECDGNLKNQPIVGMSFMSGFKRTGENWTNGKILDPGSGSNYSGKFWLKDSDTLVIRGYWGPFFRTQEWRRFGTF